MRHGPRLRGRAHVRARARGGDLDGAHGCSESCFGGGLPPFRQDTSAIRGTRLHWPRRTGTFGPAAATVYFLSTRRMAGGGGKNVVTWGLRLPAAEAQARGTWWLQARRRRAFHRRLHAALVRRQRPAAALVAERLDAALVGRQLQTAGSVGER